MCKLVIGAQSPMHVGGGAGHERRWASTVHAVPADERHGPPFEAMCGLVVAFLDLAWEWPPEPSERSCPACVRVTFEPEFGVRPGRRRTVSIAREDA